MGKFQDLTGKKFHRLYVKAIVGRDKHGQVLWQCVCDCGTEKIVSGSNLRGKTHSCGCIHRENIKTSCVTHGKSGTKTHKIWKGIISRCYATGATGYENYGGRGITVCNEWRDSFEKFLSDMGECPDGFSIDRIDCNSGYFRENCKWVDRKTQNRNTRRNLKITANDKTKCCIDWANDLGVSEATIRGRISRGWSPSAAVTVKPGTFKKKSHYEHPLITLDSQPIKNLI